MTNEYYEIIRDNVKEFDDIVKYKNELVYASIREEYKTQGYTHIILDDIVRYCEDRMLQEINVDGEYCNSIRIIYNAGDDNNKDISILINCRDWYIFDNELTDIKRLLVADDMKNIIHIMSRICYYIKKHRELLLFARDEVNKRGW